MREQLVTRSVKQFIANCTVVNSNNGDVFSREIKTTKNTDKARQQQLDKEGNNEKLCYTHDVKEVTELYTMPLYEFISHATNQEESEN